MFKSWWSLFYEFNIPDTPFLYYHRRPVSLDFPTILLFFDILIDEYVVTCVICQVSELKPQDALISELNPFSFYSFCLVIPTCLVLLFVCSFFFSFYFCFVFFFLFCFLLLFCFVFFSCGFPSCYLSQFLTITRPPRITIDKKEIPNKRLGVIFFFII